MKNSWRTLTRNNCFRLCVLLLLWCLFPAAVGGAQTTDAQTAAANAAAAVPVPENRETAAVSRFELFPDTYIPVSREVKDGLYGATKAITLGVTFPFFMAVHLYPALPPDSRGVQSMDAFFGRRCHRIFDRSFFAPNGRPFPVCSRCQGMYVGYFLGSFDFLIWDSFQIEGLTRWEQGLLHIGSYVLLFLPLIIDGTVQHNSLTYESNNAWRMTTGILFGYALTAIVDEMVQLILDYPGVYKKR